MCQWVPAVEVQERLIKRFTLLHGQLFDFQSIVPHTLFRNSYFCLKKLFIEHSATSGLFYSD
jgi:hypothetical protein